MDTMAAFAMGSLNRGKERMVFDWDKAARIIKERGLHNVGAGLSSDLEWTEGDILIDDNPVMDNYCYLASTWATPVIVVHDDENYGDEIPCFIMESKTDWDESTLWPESALIILNCEYAK